MRRHKTSVRASAVSSIVEIRHYVSFILEVIEQIEYASSTETARQIQSDWNNYITCQFDHFGFKNNTKFYFTSRPTCNTQQLKTEFDIFTLFWKI